MDQLGHNGLFEIFDLYSEVYEIDEITSCCNNRAYDASFLHFMGSLGLIIIYFIHLSSKQQGSFSKVGVNVIMSFGSSSQLLFRITAQNVGFLSRNIWSFCMMRNSLNMYFNTKGHHDL